VKTQFSPLRLGFNPAVIGIAALLLLTGCEQASRVTDYFTKPVILACPDYRILADASTLVAYKPGPGRDLIDVDFEGAINNMRLGCETRRDKETKIGNMEVDIAMDFLAQRGPANKTKSAEFPYFISVTDLNQKVLYREEFKIAASFAGNRTGIGISSDRIVLNLPLKPDVTGRSYIIYSGFILTREQLQQNRQRRKQTTR